MICPRCDDDRAEKIFEAPEDGVWEIYRCPRCYFTWRNTEEKEVTDPKLYNPKFKLTDRQIQNMAVKPPIPPLRKTGK
jgi:vanillate/4-hydroxybenzoate decarboxylase subunit D